MIRRRSTSMAGAPRGRPSRARPGGLDTAARSLWVRRVLWAATFVVVGGLLLWLLWPVFAILVAAAGLAYILDPLVDRFEARGLSRELGIGIVLGAFLGGAAIAMVVMVPPFVRKLAEVGALVSDFFATLDQQVAPLAAWIHSTTGYTVPLDVEGIKDEVPGLLEEGLPRIQAIATSTAKGLLTRGLGVINAVVNLTLLPLFTFYLLRDWDRIVAAIDELVPVPLRPRIRRVAVEVDGRLAAFIRGQLTVCAILGVVYSLGLWAAGIDMAWTIGMLSGALFIVPYLGTAVGVLLAGLVAVVDYGVDIHLLWVALTFAGAQALEGYVLTPRIVGEKVGLHPLVVIIALIVGGSLLGIWGMLLAIPVTATLSVLWTEWLDLYRNSSVYRGERSS
ncbi:MAG: AI-2E family transporter [Alphaproteobacteria bacterium]|nr:AI-2E family transporter [Alphaproteobacteria bacterium]